MGNHSFSLEMLYCLAVLRNLNFRKEAVGSYSVTVVKKGSEVTFKNVRKLL